jgi:hypothetical protein
MTILVGCEESQVVTCAFRSMGLDAVSCDLQPTRGIADWHIQDDIMRTVKSKQWDMIILHPDCTAMAVSGNRWYGKKMPRHEERLQAIQWTIELWNSAIEHAPFVALENPVSVVFNHLPNVQYVQPWQFGHGETKKTGFALHNLPPLAPTCVVDGRESRVHRMPPSSNRKRDRSVTYKGIAIAIAQQWGPLINADT